MLSDNIYQRYISRAADCRAWMEPVILWLTFSHMLSNTFKFSAYEKKIHQKFPCSNFKIVEQTSAVHCFQHLDNELRNMQQNSLGIIKNWSWWTNLEKKLKEEYKLIQLEVNWKIQLKW